MVEFQRGKLIERYRADSSGQIAVFFAILALPILAITTLAVDYTKFIQIDNNVANALDDAALAAVLDQTLTEPQRAAVATRYFWENFQENESFKLEVIESRQDRVELKATGEIDLSVSHALGMNGFEVSKMAVSEPTQETVICVLALDPKSAGSFEVSLGSNFNAVNCSVQVNSMHVSAAFVDGTSYVHAKSFCVSGGARGMFMPSVNTECRSVDDPYKDVRAPASAMCKNNKMLKLDDKGLNTVSDGFMLEPGTYCGGLRVSGVDVEFAPGIYIIQDGPLIFTAGSEAKADNVTFVMRGPKASVDVIRGSNLIAKAPSEGPLAGLVFFEDVHYIGGKGLKSLEAQSVLRGGSGMTITGTVYFPTQEIIIAGGSGVSAKAPATSFIGNRVRFTQDADIVVRSDHQKAGLPPLLPRADEGARLVR